MALITFARFLLWIWAVFWSIWLARLIIAIANKPLDSVTIRAWAYIAICTVIVWVPTLFALKKSKTGALVLLASGVLGTLIFLVLPVADEHVGEKMLLAGILGGVPIVSGLILFVRRRKE